MLTKSRSLCACNLCRSGGPTMYATPSSSAHDSPVVRSVTSPVPEGGFGSSEQMHVREAKSHIVRLGQHAERARLAIGGDQLVAQAGHLICTLDEKAAVSPGAGPLAG
jgi:hypothetical protein